MFDRGVAVTCALLERGIAEGHTPPLEVREVSRALTAMNVGYLLELLREGDALDVEAAVATLWTVWTRTTWPEAADSAEARSASCGPRRSARHPRAVAGRSRSWPAS